MTEKLHISWEEFHRDTRELCAKIKIPETMTKL